MSLRVISKRDRLHDGEVEVDTTSHSQAAWKAELSPFLIGPCELHGPYVSKNMENAWQYSKLYLCHADASGRPTQEFWRWARAGWNDARARRYPMGKGARPLCSVWFQSIWERELQLLNYIEARKQIYVPLYAEGVQKTHGWQKLRELYASGARIALRDFDGYDHRALGKTLTEVLNDPERKMGHAFVLAMLLLGDPALGECAMRESLSGPRGSA